MRIIVALGFMVAVLASIMAALFLVKLLGDLVGEWASFAPAMICLAGISWVIAGEIVEPSKK